MTNVTQSCPFHTLWFMACIAIGGYMLVGLPGQPPPAAAEMYRFEAEDGVLDGTSIRHDLPGYSGTGYVSFQSGQSVTVQADAPPGLYEVWVGYNGQYGRKEYSFQLGSERGSGGFDATATQFADDIAVVYPINGPTDIRIDRNWGWYNVDYIELRPASQQPTAPAPPQMNNPRATFSTRYLMRYLAEIYGHQTLAGQQVVTGGAAQPFPSASYLAKSGGLTPSLYASDLIDYSPTRVAFGADPNRESERVRDWATSQGGIVTMMWHWNAPDNLINTPQNPWWRGFYADATTFDLPGALADPAGDDYQKILRDIDAIAGELQKFSDTDVPVLWRPLHEVMTGGFWWGDHGPAPFVELWGLMHDRLTNHHQLDNLIWVYTTSMWQENLNAWYPGDHLVDIVGIDLYTDASSSLSGPWYELQQAMSERKMVALTETGSFPHAATMRERGTDWLWFTPWNHVPNNVSAADLQQLLSDEDIITLDELPVLPWGPLNGDFDGNGVFDVRDLNALLAEGPVASGVPAVPGTNDQFDLNGDGVIDLQDRDTWLLHAALANELDTPYLVGDANLDGGVDGSDFNLWNAGRFTNSLLWDVGDFNGDGAVDGSDFGEWNANKFRASDHPRAVPEPVGLLPWLAALWLCRRAANAAYFRSR